MKKEYFFRMLFYLLGLLFLAFGLTLNTVTGLGVSAIISVSHTVSLILNLQIGDTTFFLYALFVLAEILIHVHIAGKRGKAGLRKAIILDILQLPLSLAFTRVMNVFQAILPMLSETEGVFSTFPARFIILLVAIAFTGIGAAMSLDMKIVPNPGDGLVGACSELFRKEVGLMKNIIDLVNITLSLFLSFIFIGYPESVGIGTIAAVIGVGRVISVFNRHMLGRMQKLSGVKQ